MTVRVSTTDEQAMQASKWLDVQALLDVDEMAKLLDHLGSPLLFLTGCVCKKGETEVSKIAFLEAYGRYIDFLKKGILPEESEFRQLFSVVLTVTPDVLFSIPIEGEREILRVFKPTVQMQFHRLGYSGADGKFRPMAFGPNSIFWGVQFSYPQLYQDLKTDQPFVVDESERFPNTSLFRSIQRWMRQHTIPTPFIVDQKRSNVPMRLGKQCLSWINNHPQFKNLGVTVAL